MKLASKVSIAVLAPFILVGCGGRGLKTQPIGSIRSISSQSAGRSISIDQGGAVIGADSKRGFTTTVKPLGSPASRDGRRGIRLGQEEAPRQ